MEYQSMTKGLGLFTVALGVAELVAGRRIAGSLGAAGAAPLVRGFGLRELAAAVPLFLAPASPVGPAMRLAGDALDMGALGLAARRNPDNRMVWAAIAFVAGAALVDAYVMRGLRQVQ